MKSTEKQVKIPMSLFIQILYYFLFDETENHEQIKSDLESTSQDVRDAKQRFDNMNKK